MSEDLLRTYDPAHPREEVAAVRATSEDELERMLDDAVTAAPGWAASPPARSAALGALADELQAHAEEAAELMIAEVGKPVAEARGEVARAIAITRFYAQAALDPEGALLPSPDGRARLSSRRVPLGVVAALCPWNFPLAIPVWKALPALAWGNAVVLKPARPAIGTGALFARCAERTLPAGVMSLAVIGGERAGEMLEDRRVSAVTFTGSTEVGLSVVARMAARGAPAQAEMGGHNPAIVLEDADIDAAADAVLSGAMGFAGQKCTATRRAIAVGRAHEPLCEALAERIGSLAAGDPREESTVVGPLIDAGAVKETAEALAGALEAGGRELGRAPDPPADGHYARPAIVALDDPRARANQEETFGPLLTVLGAADPQEALRIANGTRFGLVGAVHGRDVAAATALAEELDCGLQRVNAPTTGVDYFAPFGGEGASGFGPREQGRAAREFFTRTRTLMVAPAP